MSAQPVALKETQPQVVLVIPTSASFDEVTEGLSRVHREREQQFKAARSAGKNSDFDLVGMLCLSIVRELKSREALRPESRITPAEFVQVAQDKSLWAGPIVAVASVIKPGDFASEVLEIMARFCEDVPAAREHFRTQWAPGAHLK